MRLIVLLAADLPEVGLHGLFAAGGVLLCLERSQVGSDVAQVLTTGLDHCCYRGEAVTCPEFVLARSGGALYFSAKVKTVAIAALSRLYAVGCQQHLGARMLAALARFTQCSGYMINTGTPLYFCHNS